MPQKGGNWRTRCDKSVSFDKITVGLHGVTIGRPPASLGLLVLLRARLVDGDADRLARLLLGLGEQSDGGLGPLQIFGKLGAHGVRLCVLRKTVAYLSGRTGDAVDADRIQEYERRWGDKHS